jgi:hypothetical protein
MIIVSMYLQLYLLILEYLINPFHINNFILTSKQIYINYDYKIKIKNFNKLHQYIYNLNDEYKNTMHYLQNDELKKLTLKIYNFILQNECFCYKINNVYELLQYPSPSKSIKNIIDNIKNNNIIN